MLQSFVSAVLNSFAREVDVLVAALSAPPIISPPSPQQTAASDMPDGAADAALLRTTLGIASVLARHLVAWHRFVTPAQRPLLVDVVGRLVSHVVLPLLQRAAASAAASAAAAAAAGTATTLVRETAADVLQRCARPALLRDQTIRARLAAIAGQPPPPV